MEPNPPQLPLKTAKPGFTPAIRPLIFATIACAIAIFLFSPSGPIYRYADLSFLVAPLVGYYIFRLFSRLSSIYLPAYSTLYYGSAAAYIFNGLAFSFFGYNFLGKATLLTRIPVLEGLKGLFTTLGDTTGYVILFIFGCVLSKLAGLFQELPWGRPAYPPANALGQLFIGLSLWQILAAFSDSWAPMNKIGLILFVGMLAVVIANVGTYGEKSKNPFIADASQWLRHSQHVKFLLGALIAAYILFIRPAIVGVFRYAPLVEWAIVCLIAWRLFSGIKSGLKTRCAVLLQEADWQKHIQQIANLQGSDFLHLGDIQHDYISWGNRDALLIYLTLSLNDNKLQADEINRILHPLINHQDTKPPWFAFGWEQQRILRQNEKKRQRILDEIVANLKVITNPAYQKIKEQTDEEIKPG